MDTENYLDFLRVSKESYRRFGTPVQFKVYSEGEILSLIERFGRTHNCYLSIAEHDKSGNTIPLFYPMDFDGTDLNLVEEECRRVLNWLDAVNLAYIFNFSGFKGYHILLPLTNTILFDNQDFRFFYFYIKELFKLKYLDSHCAEVKRIIRIPNTINLKSNLLCRTIKIKHGNKLNIFDYQSERENLDRQETRKYALGEDFSGSPSLDSSNHYDYPFPYDAPCIFSRINKEEVEHNVRWIWVKILQGLGYSARDIFEFACQLKWSDFEPNKTIYQIEYTMQKPVWLSCKLIKNLGLCIDRCKYRGNH